mmetsp:Transcript_15135/g.10620  ORF Transcript_15135/g.10620 Transcript_15135/m.10620 type:complete len:150 (-) Transcript_15135:1012-1461(-)
MFYSLPGATIATIFAGYTFDIFGRKLTLFAGFFFASLILAFVPYTSPSYGWLVFVRSLYAIFLAAPTTNPLIADYIHKDGLGRATVIVSIGFLIGEALAVGVLFKVTQHMTFKAAFGLIGLIAALFSFSFLFMVREPKIHKTQTDYRKR